MNEPSWAKGTNTRTIQGNIALMKWRRAHPGEVKTRMPTQREIESAERVVAMRKAQKRRSVPHRSTGLLGRFF